MAGCEKNEEEDANDSVYTIPAEYHDMTAARHLKKIHSEYVSYDWTDHNDTVTIPDSIVFIWNGDRVSGVHEYHYAISEFDNQLFLNEDITYSCTYENNRIANIHCVEIIYWNDTVGNWQSDRLEWDVPLKYTGMYLTEIDNNKVYYNDSSDVIDIKYYCEGEWVSKYKNPVWQNRNLLSLTHIDQNDGSTWPYNYTYDNKISMYRCIPRELAIFLSYGGNESSCSRNNVISTYHVTDSYVVTFSYEYDGDYPKKRVWATPNSKETTYYEYE